MINSNEIINCTKIRNARQIQNNLARKKSGIINKNQKRIMAGTQWWTTYLLSTKQAIRDMCPQAWFFVPFCHTFGLSSPLCMIPIPQADFLSAMFIWSIVPNPSVLVLFLGVVLIFVLVSVDAKYYHQLLPWRRRNVPEYNLVIRDYQLKVKEQMNALSHATSRDLPSSLRAQ
jgi:hypothetical protein